MDRAPQVTPTALVNFIELDIQAWFIFPQAIERLVRPDTVCTNIGRYLGPIHVKVGPNYYSWLENIHEPSKYTFLDEDEEQQLKVVEIKKPQYMRVA